MLVEGERCSRLFGRARLNGAWEVAAKSAPEDDREKLKLALVESVLW